MQLRSWRASTIAGRPPAADRVVCLPAAHPAVHRSTVLSQSPLCDARPPTARVMGEMCMQYKGRQDSLSTWFLKGIAKEDQAFYLVAYIQVWDGDGVRSECFLLPHLHPWNPAPQHPCCPVSSTRIRSQTNDLGVSIVHGAKAQRIDQSFWTQLSSCLLARQVPCRAQWAPAHTCSRLSLHCAIGHLDISPCKPQRRVHRKQRW